LIYFLRLSTCKYEYSLKNNQLITSLDYVGFPETHTHMCGHDKFKNYSGVSDILLNKSRVV